MNVTELGWSTLAAGLRAASRGYVEDGPGGTSTACVLGPAGWAPLGSVGQVTWAATELAIVLPTTVRRHTAAALVSLVHELLDQLDEASGAAPGSAGLVVVLQYSGEVEAAAARRVGEALGSARSSVPSLVVLSSEPGKIPALNRAFRTLDPLPRFLGWVDDDVRLEPGALAHMLALARTCQAPVAVGASKIPHTTGHRTSAALARAKRVMPSAMNYPHGCALIVTSDVVAAGIPGRYANDDGWICLRLLDPGADDPFARLVVAPGAGVHYAVAGGLRSSLLRLRRQRIGQILLTADAEPDVRRCYVRDAFLNGVDLAPCRPGRPVLPALALALYSWVHVLTTLALITELALRGATRRPLRRLAWGSPESVRVDEAGVCR